MFPWPVSVLLLSVISAVLYQPLTSDSDLVSGNVSRVLLLTAHPDDEAMFFAPTVLALTTGGSDDLPQSTSNSWGMQKTFSANSYVPLTAVYSLCLSVGNADGLGDIRVKELQRSLDVLRVPSTNRWIVDNPKLQDNITVDWDPATIAEVIKPFILEHRIRIILTFDDDGVSKHPNHKALPAGVRELLPTIPEPIRPRLFTLISVPTIGKYTSIWAATMAKFDLMASKLGQRFESLVVKALVQFNVIPEVTENTVQYAKKPPVLPVFVAGIHQYMAGFKAMLAHESQLVWFRWLYLLFSRYMWVNEWVEVKV